MSRDVASVAREWLGTPFQANQAVKGAGADCIQFAERVYREAQLLTIAVTFPSYTLGAGHHQDSSPLLDWLQDKGQFMPIRRDRVLMAGDLLVFVIGKTARTVHHVGIALDNKTFAHAIERAGVVVSNIDDPTFERRLHSVWRPLRLWIKNRPKRASHKPCTGCPGTRR